MDLSSTMTSPPTAEVHSHTVEPGGFPERRRWTRSPAVEGRARIAWRTRGHRIRKATATLIDISEGGAQIEVCSRTPRDLSFFWIGLRLLPCEWVKASIREEVPGEDTSWVYHLAFLERPSPGMLDVACDRRT